MNVEYRCPECGGRLFAKPGGTKLKCPRHQESTYVEVEEYHGPDFLHVDEEGHTESRDIILPGNTRQSKDPVTVLEPGSDTELVAYRTMYESLLGIPCDKRWSAATIKDQLQLAMHPEVESADVPNDADEGDSAGGDNGQPEPTTEPESPGVLVPDIPDDDDDDPSNNQESAG